MVTITLSLLYFVIMIYVTADRLLAVLLNMKYNVLWSVNKTKYTLIVTWVVCITLGVIVSLLYELFNLHYESYITYVHGVFDIGFIILALVTYGVLFSKYKNSLSMQTRNTECGQSDRRQSLFEVFRQSNFYISVLLITTFLLLVAVPDIIISVNLIAYNSTTEFSRHACVMLFLLSHTSDACIYILLQKKVRELIIKKLRIVISVMATRYEHNA